MDFGSFEPGGVKGARIRAVRHVWARVLVRVLCMLAAVDHLRLSVRDKSHASDPWLNPMPCADFEGFEWFSARSRARAMRAVFRVGSGRVLRVLALQITMDMHSLELWLWLLVLHGSFSADVAWHGRRAASRARK